MANSNTIELNGKKYDAISGKMLGPTKSASSAVPVIKPVTKLSPGVSMDGFQRRHKASSAAKQPSTTVHQRQQTSQTLMRKAVKKPQTIVKQASRPKPTPPTTNLSEHIVQTSQYNPNPERLARAQQVGQSQLISKFSDADPRPIGQPAIAPLDVALEPQALEIGSLAAAASTEQPFQRAIDQANSHEQQQTAKQRAHHRLAHILHISPRLVVVTGSALTLLIVGGFVAYRQVPDLAVRLASARAGVHASLPGYAPAGFGMAGPIQYKTGEIIMHYKSNSDADRNFSISQSASKWNSDALLENFVTTSGKPYQTYEENGKTIYIYNGTNATWVDGGVWYNIQDNSSSLTSDQLLRLANSI